MKRLLVLALFLALVQVSAQEITLYSIEVTHSDEWFFENENIIEVRGLALNNTPANMDFVNISFTNSSYAQGLVVRKNESYYKIRVTLFNESIGNNVSFSIFATDGPKLVSSTNHTVKIEQKPSQILSDGVNKTLLSIGNNIKQNWINYAIGFLLFWIVVIGVQFISNSNK